MKYLSYFKKNTLLLDEKKCIGCGKCLEVCPHDVFSMEDRRAGIINKGNCMECGACSKNCPVEAISVSAGVGCAEAVIRGIFTGSEPVCGCSAVDDKNSSGCC